jgi:hypothetical protein
MSTKTNRISTLIESQLPGFIASEYENFSLFVEKYYEQLESKGQPLDIIGNLETYRDIDYYEKNLLNQFTVLSENINNTDSTIFVDDASSFPQYNGYIKIDDEICFYKERTDTEFLEVSRGVSGNTRLGDLYEESNFVTTDTENHLSGVQVYNVSNLFLYAFVKSFEAQYLSDFPQRYLKSDVDKRTLIKYIGDFYRSKGTEKSIQFIFNSIVAKGADDVPSVYNPRDFTLKSSTSDWTTSYSLKVKILDGDAESLIGKKIEQYEPRYVSAIVDNVKLLGSFDGETLYEIILDKNSIFDEFEVTSKTTLTKTVSSTDVEGDVVNVFSTEGWRNRGQFLINTETFTYDTKSVNQFVIRSRSSSLSYPEGTSVYNYYTVNSGDVKFVVLGVLYDLQVENAAPYSSVGDSVEISGPGFETIDPIIYDKTTNLVRWEINSDNTAPLIPQNQVLQNALSNVIADVSAVYEDEQYYYICSSSFPSHRILNSTISGDIKDQKHLKLIRKYPTTTTEIYPVTTRDVGVFVDGTIAFSYKDEDFVSFGPIESLNLVTKGTGYRSAPFVLINGVSGKARATLSGNVVSSIEILENDDYDSNPTVEIVSGRNASVEPVITSGRITSLIINDPGEFYSSAPIVRISDRLGKGRFAEYNAIVSNDGRIIDFEVVDEGKFYTKENTIVEIIPRGSGATATAEIKRWCKNRFKQLESNLDDSYGYIFENYLPDNGYGYGRIADPVRLRASLGDNISSSLIEDTNNQHSQILGYAYDGNPIYGPYAYEEPRDSSSSITRMRSGYVLKLSRSNGPSVSTYPLGTFIDDYEWQPSVQSGKTKLDRNNGRFCVTPDYPNGVYAYFITNDTSNNPEFPYILGENYYSLPVDSNYNSSISQLDLPKNVKRLRTTNDYNNGFGVNAKIDSVKSGFVEGVDVVSSPKSFKVGNKLVFDNFDTEGSGASAFVSSVKGEDVLSIKSKGSVVKIKTSENCYLFDGETLEQNNTGVKGKIVGNIFTDNVILLEEVDGEFSSDDTFTMKDSSDNVIKVLNLLLDRNSTYTAGATLTLTDGKDSEIATGLILESTVNQNSVKVKELTGSFATTEGYFLRSTDLSNTTGSEIFTITSLSENINPFSINSNYALVTTDDTHNMALNDVVEVDVNPDDSTTETTYYVRKRVYQTVTLAAPNFETTIANSGVELFTILNIGKYIATGTYSVKFNISNEVLQRDDVVEAEGTLTITSLTEDATIEITTPGSNFNTNDIITITNIEDETLTNIIEKPPVIRVDHSGFAFNSDTLLLKSSSNLSEDDYLKINDEIVKITSINRTINTATVSRGEFETTPNNHYEGNTVSVYNPRYRFNFNYRPIGTASTDPYVLKYDEKTQEFVVSFAYTTNLDTANALVSSNIIFDQSTPSKSVRISSVNSPAFKLEFSQDQTNFAINPSIDIQKYYSYKFDTSHFSMTNTFLDFSPSFNYNIITEERFISDVAPGNSGSFVSLKIGFGPNIESNNFQTKVQTRFLNYVYFILATDVDTDNSSLNIIEDPLNGRKIVDYVTSNKFAYEVESEPQYNGSGDMAYTTTSRFSVGQINTVDIDNTGFDYKSVPIVSGVYVSDTIESLVDVEYDSITKSIVSVSVVDGGQNYTNPKIIVDNGDGAGVKFNAVQVNGSITRIDVLSGGSGYTYKPTLKVVESSPKLYARSNSIGVPQTVKLLFNGGAFHKDRTILPKYSSNYSLLLNDFNEYNISPGQLIFQKNNGKQIASGVVANDGWRIGSNILKVRSVEGEFDKSLPLLNRSGQEIAKISSILYTTFNPIVKSYYDNIGYYRSDRGKLSSNSQKLTDSYFYQDYSYVIKSKTPIDIWRDLIKQTTHPAGFKMFGEVLIESDGLSSFPEEQPKSSLISKIDLALKSITVLGSERKITQSVVKYHNTNERRGYGSVSVDTFNTEETLAYEFVLDKEFDGDYDSSTGQIVGTKTFTMLDKRTNSAISAFNENHIIVSIDGVVQEPGKAFTVYNNQITFAIPPLGKRIAEGQKVAPQAFYGKTIKFKNDTLNEQYFKKLKNIYQRNGRWIDSANQVRYNKNFITAEAIGYAKEKYPDVSWNTLEDKYIKDIKYIIDAVEFDLRFGGNFKTVSYTEMYFDGSENLNFINEQKTETLDMFDFVLNSCAAAVRNWDVTFTNKINEFTVIIEPDFDVVTLPSTFGIVPGMVVSSGSQFPDDTKVTEIISATQVKLSKKSFPDIGAFGYPPLSVSSGATYDVNSEEIYGDVSTAGTINVNLPGILVSAITRGSVAQITFYLSNINNGTFYDASNLIESNITYIKEEVLGYILDNYSISSNNFIERNIEDYIKSNVYHLRYSGNAKILQFGRNFYIDNKLIITESEKDILIDGLEKTTELMILAMQNELPTGTYTSTAPVVDSEILIDSNIPRCENVIDSLNGFLNNAETILNKGENIVRVSPSNVPLEGNWSTLKPYVNNNIILDDPIFNTECQDVLSALDSLSGAIQTTLNNGKNSVTVSLPDYFNGETDTFELYYENGDIVKTDPNEDLIISLNGVIQNSSAYSIIRSENNSVTDRVKFSDIPKWDQNDGALNLQEATAVEKAFAFSIGSYENLIINKELIPYVGKGPYLLLDKDTQTVRKVDNENYLAVFVGGVLQDSSSYSVTGSNIVFTEKLNYYTDTNGETIYPDIDIRLFYGRDIEKTLTFYDFEPDTYVNLIKVIFFGSGSYSGFVDWLRDGLQSEGDQDEVLRWAESEHSEVYIYQLNEDTQELKILGKLRGYRKVDDASWEIKFASPINYQLLKENDIRFTGPKFIFTKKLDANNVLNIVVDLLVEAGDVFTNEENSVYGTITVEGELIVPEGTTISSKFTEIVYDDSDGEVVNNFDGTLVRDSVRWIFDSELKASTWRERSSVYAKLLEGDEIKIDGEKDRREILSVPEKVNATNFNLDQVVNDSYYGTVKSTNYNGITRGEGLSVNAVVENGEVVELIWNKRQWQLFFENDFILNPSAYQYYTPPFLHFIPENNAGGGAKAEVIAYGGHILDIVLTDGGSGYTEPPKVVVSRGFNLYKTNKRIADNVRILKIAPKLNASLSTISSLVIIDSSSIDDISSITSKNVATPLDYDTNITSIIEPDEKSVSPAVVQEIISPFLQMVPKLFVNSIISTEREVQSIIATRFNVISSTTIEKIDRQIDLNIRKIITDAIHLHPLPTVNDIGAFLQIDLNETEDIIYIADTRNFPDSGRLLVGKEIVTYQSKLTDRFLDVQRGTFNTVATTHSAGDYLRNLPDFTSVVSAPSITITTESKVSVESIAPSEIVKITSYFDKVNNNVSLVSSNFYQNTTTKTGVIDYVGNETYELGSLIPSFSNFEKSKFNTAGVAKVSELTLEMIDLYYPELTILDFTDRIKSSYTITKDWFNLTTVSINEYATILSANFSNVEILTINVNSTSGFPTSGKLIIGNEIVYYQSKTQTTFDSLLRGQENTIAQEWNINQYIRSFS